jgi:F-type H+-transporting ATPase subunit epsilon
MYERPFKLQIVTPAGILYQSDATSLTAPGTQGSFQVLYSHAPFLSTLEIGELKVKGKDGNDLLFATSGGIVEVKDNGVVVLAETAEASASIDVQRAQRANERAVARIRSKDSDVDLERARLSMMRALNRLRVASKL